MSWDTIGHLIVHAYKVITRYRSLCVLKNLHTPPLAGYNEPDGGSGGLNSMAWNQEFPISIVYLPPSEVCPILVLSNASSNYRVVNDLYGRALE